jgi:hypothetical protein
MTSPTLPRLIVELAANSSVDRQLRAHPPSSVANGHVVLDHIAPAESGRLGPPEAGEVILSVLSPEAFTREQQEVRDVISQAERTDQPLVIIVEAAEELREEELAVVVDAAEHADRLIILRIIADTTLVD